MTKSISGDALFFVLNQIEGDLYKNGTFVGIVSYVDYQTSTMKGTFTADDRYLYLDVKGEKKPYKLRYWFRDKERSKITVEDENFGVTMQLYKKPYRKGETLKEIKKQKKENSQAENILED